MRKRFSALMLAACVFFAGCSNEFAIEEYNDAAKLADSGDRSLTFLAASIASVSSFSTGNTLAPSGA